ncbi:ribonuclease P protein component [Candidatus Dojkabacteria bacterium]|uniref:Ribonuclease P protein component n=1 Tax=Candidatus Dojkabacteria bacterium TaxID=2099670 RepID=A0A955RK86_9BACT|nr:ribonuclease P protein component [Candidatus Dojkabacteria bacterium]
MLPAKHRILKQYEFDQIYRHHNKLRGNYLQILVRFVDKEQKVDHKKYPRFGFVVSKKVHKHAVKRNKIKRQLREIIKELLPTLPQSFEALVIPYPKALETSFQELKDDVTKLLSTVN